RAAKATQQAEQTRREADQHAKQLLANARKNSEQIIAEAKAQAEQLLAETKAEAERIRTAAQRQVDELTRQRDSITSHLNQLRQLLGGGGPMMPPLGATPTEEVSAAPEKPA